MIQSASKDHFKEKSQKKTLVFPLYLQIGSLFMFGKFSRLANYLVYVTIHVLWITDNGYAAQLVGYPDKFSMKYTLLLYFT